MKDLSYNLNLFLKNKQFGIKINNYTKFIDIKNSFILKGTHNITKNKLLVLLNPKLQIIKRNNKKNKIYLFKKKKNLINNKFQVYTNG